ncbi:response regulator [Flavisolibacter nicotianae]|uniref:response regulator n=1 Tax=Flavisolibacter nicotianae TaxID=2364882 RepID=UPI000EB40207|nr:response regulator [Flavisolibacter nicotianae]
MNGFFRRLALPAKLALLGLLPLLFLVVVVFQYNNEKNQKLAMLDGYRNRIKQAVSINELVDVLQMERRYSFVYATNNTLQTEMLQQRTRVDDVSRRVGEEGEEMTGYESYTFLDQLKNVRTRVDNHEIQPLDVLNFYTNAIFRLTSLNNVAAGNVLYLQPVIKAVRGQKLLSDIITYKGIVLAQIYFLLESKQQNPQLIASINQMQEIIASYVREFTLKGPPAKVAELNNLRTEANTKQAAAVEAAVATTRKIDTTVNGDVYWAAATNAVNKLKALQASMIQEAGKGADEIYRREKQQQTWSLVMLLAILALVAVFLVYTIRVITSSLSDLRTAAEDLAAGRTGLSIRPESNDAIGSLTRSILSLDNNSQQLALAAKVIGDGDFSAPVHPRSKDDVLGNSLVHMRDNLQQYAKESDEKIWTQTGLSSLSDLLRGEKTIDEISRNSINLLVPYLGCESGLFYSAYENRLHFEAGYAVSKMDEVPKDLQFGETLIGQAAAQKQLLHLKDVPESFLQIRSGLGTSHPKHVVVVPLYADTIVKGIIEIASLHEIDEYKIAFLREAATDIAISIRTARSKVQLQKLLEQTQAQAEELQAQHAELENINAELEAQAEKLQTSEEELKVQQEELMQANQELEERTRQLEERNALIVERNIEIQQKAEELALSTKYKSEFLANMSHELRTPLNSILLLSRLLAENNETNLNHEQVEYAKVIQSSGQGLLSLIDEILDLSKIEAGKMQLEYVPVIVQEITADMKALFAPVAREKGIGFEINVAPEVPSQLETDKLRLEQVLRNLLSNAIKFTAQGSVQLNVSTLPDDHPFLAFTVKDTGIGIPAEKQALIFEAFQQADGSTRRKYGGTGLGLSISRELIRLLGGEIKLASEPGKGSEFTVYVPKAKMKDVPMPAAVPEPVVAAETTVTRPAKAKNFRSDKIPESLPDDRNSTNSQDKTILIIEDDTAFAKALLDYTHQKGYKGLVAVRGDEGIALAQQYRPTGILLDIQLPVKDGWEVMEELKANPATRHIPVHMMSAYEAKKESLQKGAIDFISKPVAFDQMQEVFKKIEHVLSKEHKKVLIVEENPQHAKALAYFLESFHVSAQISPTVNEGVNALQKDEVDCVILDMGIPDQQAYETLETVKQNPGLENLPIIIFTGKSLSKTEESKIRQYADSIVIKTAHSYQRILDEVSLFLHLVEEASRKDKPAGYRRMGALNEVLSGKKILVTDDDVRNIFSLTKALELHNVQVIAAMDGKEALQKLAENPDINAVLMDIMMPEMDGYEAMQQIRKKPQYRNLPIIAITAKAMTGDREKCIKAGASDYISKPVDIDQLLSLLRVWLYDKSF